MRQYYLDNLRWMAVLLVVVFHVFWIYSWIMEFYIMGYENVFLRDLLYLINYWIMPLMFIIAGISTAYALKKRTPKEYLKERVLKLFVPLIAGIVLVMPTITYFARLYRGADGNFIDQFVYFFTHFSATDSYAGGFTVGHLWFLMFLFLFSLIIVPIAILYNRSKHKLPFERMNFLLVMCLFMIPLIASYDYEIGLNIGGRSLTENFAYFVIGYFVLSCEGILIKADKYRFAVSAVSIALCTLLVLSYFGIKLDLPDFVQNMIKYLFMWSTILAFLGLGRHYLNFRNKMTDYFSASSFAVYIFHLSWVIGICYWTMLHTDDPTIQILVTLALSFPATFLTYEVIRRIPVIRSLFAIKPPKKEMKTN